MGNKFYEKVYKIIKQFYLIILYIFLKQIKNSSKKEKDTSPVILVLNVNVI